MSSELCGKCGEMVEKDDMERHRKLCGRFDFGKKIKRTSSDLPMSSTSKKKPPVFSTSTPDLDKYTRELRNPRLREIRKRKLSSTFDTRSIFMPDSSLSKEQIEMDKRKSVDKNELYDWWRRLQIQYGSGTERTEMAFRYFRVVRAQVVNSWNLRMEYFKGKIDNYKHLVNLLKEQKGKLEKKHLQHTKELKELRKRANTHLIVIEKLKNMNVDVNERNKDLVIQMDKYKTEKEEEEKKMKRDLKDAEGKIEILKKSKIEHESRIEEISKMKVTVREYERKFTNFMKHSKVKDAQLEKKNEEIENHKEEARKMIKVLKKKNLELEERRKKIDSEFEECKQRLEAVLPTKMMGLKESECYDFVFDIENLEDGGGEGWNVYDYSNKLNRELGHVGVITMTMVGFFGVGKSYVHSKIAGLKLPSGSVTHTRGLSVRCFDAPKSENLVIELVDVAGFQNCVNMKKQKMKENATKEKKKKLKKKVGRTINIGRPEEEEETEGEEGEEEDFERIHNRVLKDKKRDEEFIYRLSLRMSSIFIVVVSQLSMLQQTMIEEVKSEIRMSNSTGDMRKKDMYVIHNLKNVTQIKEFDACVKEVCENIYDVKDFKITPPGCDIMIKYYQEIKDDRRRRKNGAEPVLVKHFFLGREGTPAGEKNEGVFQFFRMLQLVGNSVEICRQRFVTRLTNELNKLIPRFIRYVPQKKCTEYIPIVDEEKEEKEEMMVMIKKPCGRIRYRVKDLYGSEEGSSSEERRRAIVYRWKPNVSFGSKGSGFGNDDEFITINWDCFYQTIDEEEERRVFKLMIDVPGIRGENLVEKKNKEYQKMAQKRQESGEDGPIGLTYGYWAIARGRRVLYIKFKRRRRFEVLDEVQVGEWERKFDIPLDVQIREKMKEGVDVIVSNELVTFVFDVYQD